MDGISSNMPIYILSPFYITDNYLFFLISHLPFLLHRMAESDGRKVIEIKVVILGNTG